MKNAPAMKNLAAPAIRLHPNDSVLVARVDLAQGSVLAEENITCLNRIPAGQQNMPARASRPNHPNRSRRDAESSTRDACAPRNGIES